MQQHSDDLPRRLSILPAALGVVVGSADFGGLTVISLLLLVSMNRRDVGSWLVARWLGYAGLLSMANEVFEILNGAHSGNCGARCIHPVALGQNELKTKEGSGLISCRW